MNNKLTHDQAVKLGWFDNCSRWWPTNNARVDGSFYVIQPSRANKFTYLEHAKSEGYFKLLKEQNPELLAEVTK